MALEGPDGMNGDNELKNFVEHRRGDITNANFFLCFFSFLLSDDIFCLNLYIIMHLYVRCMLIPTELFHKLVPMGINVKNMDE